MDQEGTSHTTIAKATKLVSISASKMTALIGPTGKFIYSYRHTNGIPSNGYNVARHSGALWAILTARHFETNPSLKADYINAATVGMRWLVACCGRPIEDAIWFTDHKARSITLGNNALALLAASEYCSACPNDQNSRLCWAIAAGVMRMMKPDCTDFDHKYLLTPSSYRCSDFKSIYYVGEALFSVARFWNIWLSFPVRLQSDVHVAAFREWLPRLLKCLLHLQRQDYGIAVQSHWMMYAVSEMYMVSAQARSSEIGLNIAPLLDILCKLREYGEALADAVASEDSYLHGERATPIACRNEGLLALLLSGLVADCPRRLEMEARVRTGIELQVQLGVQRDGAVVRSRDDDCVRIDFIQHHSSAMQMWLKYLQSAKS